MQLEQLKSCVSVSEQTELGVPMRTMAQACLYLCHSLGNITL